MKASKLAGNFYGRLILVFLSASFFSHELQAIPYPGGYKVSWNGQSRDAMGSMPIGNGDVGANVWVTQEGTLHLLLSKTDSYSEIGRLLKIGKLEMRMTPNLLEAALFRQELVPDSGFIRLTATKEGRRIELRCWMDANAPVLHVEGRSDIPVKLTLTSRIWRNTSRAITGDERHSGYGVTFRQEPFWSETDTVPVSKDGILWFHENRSSIWRLTLENQQMADFAQYSRDPLLGRRFGAMAAGTGMRPTDPQTLVSESPSGNIRIDIAVRASAYETSASWLSGIRNTLRKSLSEKTKDRFARHVKWWKDLFDRHRIVVRSEKDSDAAYRVTQGYMLQRYMNACAGRGAMPIKFNGSIFTTEVVQDIGNVKKGFDADFRAWGGNFWFQNTRLIYWNMPYAGDTEFMEPLFDMYLKALPLARFRTRRFFGHEGAYFTETLTPWGSYLPDNYGWDRKGKPMGVSDNLYIRYYWQGGLELSAMMMDYQDFTGHDERFRSQMAPFIAEIIRFYDQHYKRGADGKLHISPAQALETYQEGATDPTPELAGLRHCLERITGWHKRFFRSGFLDTCERLYRELPPIALETKEGGQRIAAGRNLGPRLNIENPELYTIFPYRIHGVGKPDLALARHTFNTRIEKHVGCWYQDAIQAALLGYTDEAKKMVEETFSASHPGSRFPVFWGPNNDWLPDQDHGGGGMSALQYMLVQHQDRKVWLFPAWPKSWDVDFKIHLPGNRILEGSYSEKDGVKFKQKPSDLDLSVMIQ
jgi:hypothetical protein